MNAKAENYLEPGKADAHHKDIAEDEGKSLKAIFEWLDATKQLKKPYSLLLSNCNTFLGDVCSAFAILSSEVKKVFPAHTGGHIRHPTANNH